MAQLLDIGLFSVASPDGSAGVGWKLNFYTTGTSSRKNTYPTAADALAGTNANANPVIADSAGRFPAIWLTEDAAYKAVLTDASDVVKATRDPVNQSLVLGSLQSALASEAISAGEFVNLYWSGGVLRVRKAIANDITKFAWGFAPSAISSGASGTLALGPGTNTTAVPSTDAECFLSDSVAGAFTTTAPSAAGSFVQSLGLPVPGVGILFTLQPRYPQ